MKTTKTVDLCDFCNKEETHKYCACHECGKHICYNCLKKHGVERRHAVYVTGGIDGRYCKACNDRLTASGDKLMAAFQVVEDLIAERIKFSEDFERRKTAAERAVSDLSQYRR